MSFDPYRKWLGIPSNRRPPTYYELLGITAGENDADVIRSAIDQRRMYVRSKLGEGQDGHVKAILGLIEEATSTLLVPEFKHGYDRQLGLHLKKAGSRRSYVLPSWMESRVVRVYGEGSGIVGDLLGIVSILLAAFGLMAWWSFRLQDRTNVNAQSLVLEPIPIVQAEIPVVPQVVDVRAQPPIDGPKDALETKEKLADHDSKQVTESENKKSVDKVILNGTYLIEWKEENGKTGNLEYEFLPNLSVIRAGKIAGKLSLQDEQVRLNFEEKRRGSVLIKDITDESFSGSHTWEDGKKSTWIAKRKNGAREAIASANLPIPRPVLWLSGDKEPTDGKIVRRGGKVAEGKFGKGIQFDGNSLMEMYTSLPAGNSPRTMAVWLRNERLNWKGYVGIVVYGPNESTKPFGLIQSAGKWRFFDFNGGLDSGIEVDTNWHHHAVTSDGITLRYYVDGIKVGNVDKPLTTMVGTLKIGGLDEGTTFVGTIDELYFFDVPLSEEQIQLIMQNKVNAN